jgi:hypothetical protein
MINWDNLSFVFAKTMADIPHWYVVRSPANEADFIELFATIRRDGVIKEWRGRKYRYWYRGDGFRYWPMPDFLPNCKIINRAKVEPDDVTESPADDGLRGGDPPA